jgi:hypothetical protein
MIEADIFYQIFLEFLENYKGEGNNNPYKQYKLLFDKFDIKQIQKDRLTRLYSSKTAKVWALIRMLLYLRIPPVKYNKSYLEYSIKNVMLIDDGYRNRWS